MNFQLTAYHAMNAQPGVTATTAEKDLEEYWHAGSLLDPARGVRVGHLEARITWEATDQDVLWTITLALEPDDGDGVTVEEEQIAVTSTGPLAWVGLVGAIAALLNRLHPANASL